MLVKDLLNKLDDCGIVYVGAEVVPGDILVGKITPKEKPSFHLKKNY